MSMEHIQAYCKDCEKRIRAERKGTNHILHLILTIFTAGLWLIIWVGSAIKFGGWSCPSCGGNRLQHKSLFGSLLKSKGTP
jgi:hypothetical protein